MSIFVKICGLSTNEAVQAAVSAGANAVGFVFADSPRKVTVEQALELAQQLPPGIVRVAVMRHPDHRECAAILQRFRPDWVQTDAEDFADLDIGPEVQHLPVYRDDPALDDAAIAQRMKKEARVLFEAPASGQGHKADWNRARIFAATTDLILAGGLDPENVAAAIEQVRPWGVDVSSGVERSRGEKDPGRITAFIDAVRSGV